MAFVIISTWFHSCHGKAGAGGLEPPKCRDQNPVPCQLGDAPILQYRLVSEQHSYETAISARVSIITLLFKKCKNEFYLKNSQLLRKTDLTALLAMHYKKVCIEQNFSVTPTTLAQNADL